MSIFVVKKLSVRLDDATAEALTPRLRQKHGCSATGFFEALSRMYLAGDVPELLLEQITAAARGVDAERAQR